MASAPDESQPVRGYIDGCFDIMHSGHYNAIRQAKSLCDVLVVGVHSDPEIEENKSVPVMRQKERYALLDHIKWIDEILPDVPYSPEIATLDKARASFCVHGDDMPVNSQGFCAYDEMKHAGRLRIVKRTEGVSTTDLIGRLLTLSRHQHTVDAPSSPTGGVRITADNFIQQCAVSIEASESDPDTSAALKLIAELAKTYNMSADDVAKLKDTVSGSIGTAVPENKFSPEPRALLSTPTKDGADTRTSAPVQLLASTRRITEFATGRQPTADDRVVYVCGSFDMFHVGHADFLKDARKLGTFLLVGIYEDLAVSRSKGPNFPVMSLNERILNVCACKWVDEVIIGAPLQVTQDLVKTWDIHAVAKGTGHARNEGNAEAQDHHAIAAELGICHDIPSKWPDLCHETIVQRIISGREVFLKRNKDRARREDAYYAGKDQSNQPAEG